MNGLEAPGAGGMIRLVAGREIRERLRAKSFYVATALLVLVILAFGLISRFLDGGGPGSIDVGIAGEAPAELDGSLTDAATLLDRDANVATFDDVAAAHAALEDGDVDVVLIVEERRVVFADDIDDQTLAVVQQAWASVETRQALGDVGLDREQIGAVLSTTPIEAVTLDGSEDPTGVAVLAGTMAAILLFISLQTFGTYVLTGVVEEKSSAVIELLLVRAPPDRLLAGKVIGIGVAALAQFALAVLAGLASLAISGVEVPGEIWSALPMTVVWFLGGYALYSTVFALAGSLVSRQEDAQAAAAPIFTALVGAYLLVFVLGYTPESTASTIMSLIPPIAPLLMPMRMVAGAASGVEVAAALVLLVLTTLAVWKLAGRIFEQVLLRRGSRISWRDAAMLIRHR